MKSFAQQFEVCAAEGMHGRGPVLPYALHAGLIPHDPVAGKYRIESGGGAANGGVSKVWLRWEPGVCGVEE